MQEGDVQLFQEPDGGEITVENGITAMSSGLDTAAYLSLFGGNTEDPGGDDTKRSWWGNVGENEVSRIYRSEFQYLVESIPLNTANLNALADAAKRDLNWMIVEKVTSSVEVELTLPALNTLGVKISITAEGEEEQFEYAINWKEA